MNFCKTASLLAAAVGLLVLATSSWATTPKLMNYQGKVTDADGNPVADGLHTVQFDLFGDAMTGTSMWHEETTVTTSDGLFSHDLGSITPMIDNAFRSYEELWLQITFDGQVQGTRTQFTSVGYAFHVESINNAEGGNVKDGISIYDPYTDNEIAGLQADGNGSSQLWLQGGDVDQVYHNITLNAETNSLEFVDRTDGRDTTTYGMHSLKMTDHVQLVDSTGLHMELASTSTEPLDGVYSRVGSTSDPGTRTAIYAHVQGDNTSESHLYALDAYASGVSKTAGSTFGIAVAASGGTGSHAYGIHSAAYGTGDNYAGYFTGDVYVGGTLSKSAGAFKIDHPLDPERKYLQHSFVESPDMKNIYDGTVTTDGNAEAVVTLPDYFSALNKDFRYQLTVIGQFAQAIIAEEISDNRFVIQTDKPNVKVSWQVTGIRKDAWAEAHRIEVEVDKPADRIGTYLNPEEFGQPQEKSATWEITRRWLEDQAIRDAQE